MKHNAFFIILFFLLSAGNHEADRDCHIKHIVEIGHPGISKDTPVEATLIQSQCGPDEPAEFYMDVESVVCGDQQCRVDIVRVFWDELGFYKGLKLMSDLDLEKEGGKSFTAADYRKLDQVLSNQKSGLADVFKGDIVANSSGEGVDATSGATIMLHVNDYIKGAVWTSYTLWHWVNGDTYKIIRNITGNSKSAEQLRQIIASGSERYKKFALEQLIRFKNYEPATIQKVLETQIQNNNLADLVVEYIEGFPSHQYFTAMTTLLQSTSNEKRLIYLNALVKTEKSAPVGYFDKLSYLLPKWDRYPLTNNFLNILEKKNISSQEINDQVILLLNNDSFLIARRAYWFLKGQDLSASQRDILEDFFANNRAKL